MEMIHGDFKIGESCPRAGTYACTSCHRAGRETTVALEQGAVFPFCAACREKGTDEVDVVWNAVASRRSA